MSDATDEFIQIQALVNELRAQQSVLIVDDDERVRWTLERQLKSLNVVLHFAEDGEAAQHVLSQQPISVIVTDQRMPGMQGTALLSWVKTQFPDVVRVMITANVETDTALAAINTGEVFRFVPKPWSQDDIRQAVTSALEQHRARGERQLLMAEIARANESLRGMNDHLLELVEERAGEIRQQAEHLAKANADLRESFDAALEVVATIVGFADLRIMDHCKRTVLRVRAFALRAGLKHTWIEPLSHAALCHWVGLINAPSATVSQRLEDMRPDDLGSWEYHPVVGEIVLSQVPALALAAQIVGNYLRDPNDEAFEGQPDLRMSCQCLKLASFYEREFTIRNGHLTGKEGANALASLESMRGRGVDSALLDVFRKHLPDDASSA